MLWAESVRGAMHFVSLEGRTLRDCKTNAVPLCRTIKTKVSGVPAVHAFGEVLGLTIGTKSYLWQASKLVSVSGLPAGSKATFTADGVNTRPVVTVRGSRVGFYTVATNGRVGNFVSAVVEPVAVRSLGLGAGWLVGTDSMNSDRAWMRASGAATLGNQVVLSKKAHEVRAFGDRVVVNGGDGLWFYRNGTRTAKQKAVFKLGSLSGPYALVQPKKNGTWSLRTESKVIASGIRNAIGVFGTNVASLDPVGAVVSVSDYASGTAAPVGDPVGYDTALGTPVRGDLWGDTVMLVQKRRDAATGEDSYTTLVQDYRTGGQFGPRELSATSLGDGVVAGIDASGRSVVWDFADDEVTVLPTAVSAPYVSGIGAVGYADANGLLRVSDLDGAAGGTSAPRALTQAVDNGFGVSYFVSYDGWRKPWTVTDRSHEGARRWHAHHQAGRGRRGRAHRDGVGARHRLGQLGRDQGRRRPAG